MLGRYHRSRSATWPPSAVSSSIEIYAAKARPVDQREKAREAAAPRACRGSACAACGWASACRRRRRPRRGAPTACGGSTRRRTAPAADFFWSLKVWIGPCSLSRNGRPSRDLGDRFAHDAARWRAPARRCCAGGRSCPPRRGGWSRNRGRGGGRSAPSAADAAATTARGRTARRSAGGRGRAAAARASHVRLRSSMNSANTSALALGLRRMDLVPEVPREQRAAAAPALDREAEARLDRAPRLGVSRTRLGSRRGSRRWRGCRDDAASASRSRRCRRASAAGAGRAARRGRTDRPRAAPSPQDVDEATTTVPWSGTAGRAHSCRIFGKRNDAKIHSGGVHEQKSSALWPLQAAWLLWNRPNCTSSLSKTTSRGHHRIA